jgi:type III secretion protein R
MDGSPSITALLAIALGLGLLTFAVVTTTAFLKITVVLLLVRNALGVQQVPPNIVVYAAALILTVYISAPVGDQIYRQLANSSFEYRTFDDWTSAAARAREPLRAHLLRFTTEDERKFFQSATQRIWPSDMQQRAGPDDLTILIPSFMIAELKRAFEIGFLLYLPFLTIDLVVTTILMAMGMAMVSPTIISVPFKLFLFIAVDGWSRLLHGLVLSYGSSGP